MEDNKNIFDLIDSDKYLELVNSDLFWRRVDTYENQYDYIDNVKGEIFYNKERNLTLVFEQTRDDDEEFLEYTPDIIDYVSGDVYNNLIEYINSHTNATIYFTQVYGTTTDYTILEGVTLDDLYVELCVSNSRGNLTNIEILDTDMLNALIADAKEECGETANYKYLIIDGTGKCSRFC